MSVHSKQNIFLLRSYGWSVRPLEFLFLDGLYYLLSEISSLYGVRVIREDGILEYLTELGLKL